MNKKIFTVILVVLLAMTCAFAYKGEIKVGLSAGAGSNNVSYDDEINRLIGILMGGNLTALFTMVFLMILTLSLKQV